MTAIDDLMAMEFDYSVFDTDMPDIDIDMPDLADIIAYEDNILTPQAKAVIEALEADIRHLRHRINHSNLVDDRAVLSQVLARVEANITTFKQHCV